MAEAEVAGTAISENGEADVNKPLISGHAEAKLTSLSNREDGGIRVGFVIQPDDVTQELRAARPGTFFVLGYQEFDPDAKEPPQTEKPERERVPFDKLKPSQQAGMLCKKPEFREFLSQIGQPCPNEQDAIDRVRYICNVPSRAKIGVDNWYWTNLVADYRDWQRTDARYSGTPAYEKSRARELTEAEHGTE